MARVARSRSRITLGTHSGNYKWYFSNVLQSTTVITSGNRGREFCNDSVGAPWVDSEFNHRVGVAPRVTLDGQRVQGSSRYVSTDLPMHENGYLRLREPFTYGGFNRPVLGNLAALALANANPNRPDVDLPVSIAELRELPSLLKDATGLIAGISRPGRTSAKANLMVQFGLIPIVNDIRSLFNFAESVSKREQYLRELSAGSKRIKRKLAVERWTHTEADLVGIWNGTAENSTTTNRIRFSGKMTRTYWYTMRASLIDVLSEREIRSLAPQLVTGTHTVSAKQIWELVPWSWLIDWFSDTGDILAAFRGGLRWQWSGLNVMYKTDYHITGVFPNKRSGFTYTPSTPQSHAVTHNRVQPAVSIYPTWRIPYLTGRQWSILSSLLALRL